MALPTLSQLQAPSLNHSLFPSQNPNPITVSASASASASLRSSLRRKNPLLSLVSGCPPAPRPPLLRIRYSAGHDGDYEHERIVHPRPQEVPWSKDLANSVNLIGIVGAPIQIKHLSSGKVLAWTRLGVKKSPSETSWINLTFWNDLAHVAFQHVEKGNQVYVSGRLVSDVVEGEDEKRQVYFKVVVQQLNFVEKSFPAISLYDPEAYSASSGTKLGSYTGNSSSTTEDLWQAFFANPVDWWDNRKNKRNPKAPDFKHKHTGEALWIEAKNSPPWVKSQLAVLDSRMSSIQANGTSSGVSFIRGDDLLPF